MPEILVQYEAEIWQSIGETITMVGVSILAAILIGLPVGTLLFLCRKGHLLENPWAFSILNLFVNIIRSFPFLLLVVFFNPVYKTHNWHSHWDSSCLRSISDHCHCPLFAIGRAIIIGRAKGCDRGSHFHGCFC